MYVLWQKPAMHIFGYEAGMVAYEAGMGEWVNACTHE